MNMEMLHDLKNIMCMELGILVDKAKKHEYQMAPGDLETYKKLTAILESVTVIEQAEDDGYSQDDGMAYSQATGMRYSRDGGWEARGRYETGRHSMDGGQSYGGGYSYDDGRGRGRSYANRGQHYVRAHYSRADEVEHLKEQLQEIMHTADLDEQQKKAIKQAVEAMDK